MMQHALGVNGFASIEGSTNIITAWFEQGRTGVTLFLVLSGFLFTLIVKGGEHKLIYRKFIYNRFLRIFPLLIFVFLMLLTAARAQLQGVDLLNLFFLQLNIGNPSTGFGNEFLPIGPIWTIAVEFQFYLIFPFIIIFLKKHGIKYLLGLIVTVISIRFLMWLLIDNVYWNLYHTLIGRLDQFLLGILLGLFYLLKKRIYFKNPIWLLLSCAALSIFISEKKIDLFHGVLGFTLEALLWGIIIICYLDLKLPIPRLLDRTFSKLGELSFSFYLFHLMILIMVKEHVGVLSIMDSAKGNVLISTIVISLPLTIFLSLLTYYFIEKPFMNFRVTYLIKSK